MNVLKTGCFPNNLNLQYRFCLKLEHAALQFQDYIEHQLIASNTFFNIVLISQNLLILLIILFCKLYIKALQALLRLNNYLSNRKACVLFNTVTSDLGGPHELALRHLLFLIYIMKICSNVNG